VGVAMDITGRVRAEEEVQRLKNYLANIIDSMPSILVGLDPKEIVTQWNRTAETATGIPAGQAIGRPLQSLLPDFSPWINGAQSEIMQGRPASKEKLLVVKDGESRFYDLMLYPLAANGIEGSVVRIEDSTERVRIQNLMIQTEKMMSVGGLAAGMAHEINNPLGIIAQAAQNIERRVSADLPANQAVAKELGLGMDGMKAYFDKREIFQFIRDIGDASARAAKIVANMLQFSRKSEAVKQPVPLADILDHSVELAANDFDLKKKHDFLRIELVREYDPALPLVPVIAVELEQVVLNLLRNAAQALAGNPPQRRPRIILRIRRDEKYAVVEVIDNGPGMSEDVRRRVFEPFFTTKEPGVGTGLGLSVSYMIVTQNHNGLLAVESSPGNGARFTIRLPLQAEAGR
jgi:PAS domain S-box-containing protein